MINVGRFPLIRLSLLLGGRRVSMLCEKSILCGDCEVSHREMHELTQYHFGIWQTLIDRITVGDIIYRQNFNYFADWVVSDVLLKISTHSIGGFSLVPFLYVNSDQLTIRLQLRTFNLFSQKHQPFYQFF